MRGTFKVLDSLSTAPRHATDPAPQGSARACPRRRAGFPRPGIPIAGTYSPIRNATVRNATRLLRRLHRHRHHVITAKGEKAILPSLSPLIVPCGCDRLLLLVFSCVGARHGPTSSCAA